MGRTGKLNVPNHGPIVRTIKSVQSTPSSAPTVAAMKTRKARVSGRSDLRRTTHAAPMTTPNGRLQSTKASRSPIPNPSCKAAQQPAPTTDEVITVPVAPTAT